MGIFLKIGEPWSQIFQKCPFCPRQCPLFRCHCLALKTYEVIANFAGPVAVLLGFRFWNGPRPAPNTRWPYTLQLLSVNPDFLRKLSKTVRQNGAKITENAGVHFVEK